VTVTAAYLCDPLNGVFGLLFDDFGNFMDIVHGDSVEARGRGDDRLPDMRVIAHSQQFRGRIALARLFAETVCCVC
jgi:hypothetical protein